MALRTRPARTLGQLGFVAALSLFGEGLRRGGRPSTARLVRIPTNPATHSDVKAATHSEAKAATLPELAASRAHGGSKWPP